MHRCSRLNGRTAISMRCSTSHAYNAKVLKINYVDDQHCWWQRVSLRQRTVVNADHRVGWTQFSAVRRLSRRLLYWSKNAIFTYPTCIWRPRWGSSHRNFVDIFCIIKLESMGYLLFGVVFVILRWATLMAWRTDRRTNTEPQHRAR